MMSSSNKGIRVKAKPPVFPVWPAALLFVRPAMLSNDKARRMAANIA